MVPLKICDNIYYVGVVDHDLRYFHGYATQKGTTYNSYLILDEKVTLIDTVKAGFGDELIRNISHIIDPSKIDYIISNHVEMDHSGSIPKIMEYAKNATIVTSSPSGEKGLRLHYGDKYNYKVVKSGDTLNLGKHNLSFYLTPMVHWPDNMVCYLQEEKILFSNDAFGLHYASSQRFDDECEMQTIIEEAKKYYANIVMPYRDNAQKAIKSIENLEIKYICNSHGIIWRTYIDKIIELYKKWSTFENEERAIIVYDTMWGSTKSMAVSIEEAFLKKGIATKLSNLQTTHMSDIIKDILDAKYVCVGSPTLNNNMLPTIGGFLTYLKGLRPKNKIGLAFGSYGWGGESVAQIETILKECGMELLQDKIKIQYVPKSEDLETITKSIYEKL